MARKAGAPIPQQTAQAFDALADLIGDSVWRDFRDHHESTTGKKPTNSREAKAAVDKPNAKRGRA